MEKIDSNDDKIYQQSYTVRIHEINKDGAITIPGLIALLQETSMQHIIKLKASSWGLKSMSLSWVLLTKQLKIKRLPQRGERITVITYPTAFDKFFAYRDYLVFDGDKKLIVTAATKWSLIDTKTRKLSRVPEYIIPLAVDRSVKELERPVSKIKIPTEVTNVKSAVIESYDLDWNGHVNNIKLCQLMFQSLLTAGQKEEQITMIDFQFKNESLLGDELTVGISSDRCISMIMRGDNLICAMKVWTSVKD